MLQNGEGIFTLQLGFPFRSTSEPQLLMRSTCPPMLHERAFFTPRAQIEIPALRPLTEAHNFSGWLDKGPNQQCS